MKSTNHRISFIGDSFTEGVTLNYEDTFAGLIDAALSQRQIEVLNAGRSSYSPIIYWRKIKYLIEDIGLQFDEVVVYIDISDSYDEARIYDLSENNIVIQKPQQTINRFWSRPVYNIKNLLHNNTTIIFNTLNFLYTPFGFKQSWEKRIGDNLGKVGKRWWQFIDLNNYKKDKWTIDNALYNSYGKEGNILMKKYMKKLSKILNNNGINLTIAVYPWPSQIWYEDLNSIHVDIWKEWSQKNNAKFINYFPDFITMNLSENEKLKVLEKYYILGDVHFNKEGNRVLASKFIKNYQNH